MVTPTVVAVADERRVKRTAVTATLSAPVRRLCAVVIRVLMLAATAAVPRTRCDVIKEFAARAPLHAADIAALDLLVLAEAVVAHAAASRTHTHAVPITRQTRPADHRRLRPLRRRCSGGDALHRCCDAPAHPAISQQLWESQLWTAPHATQGGACRPARAGPPAARARAVDAFPSGFHRSRGPSRPPRFRRFWIQAPGLTAAGESLYSCMYRK
eukprot:COSAG02_NODE_237_length_27732_cov_9.584374_5_plen_214_part_00